MTRIGLIQLSLTIPVSGRLNHGVPSFNPKKPTITLSDMILILLYKLDDLSKWPLFKWRIAENA